MSIRFCSGNSNNLECYFRFHYMTELYERYEAAMVMSAAGDALGYKNGEWEICQSGRDIQRELRNMGGIQAIHVKRKLFKSYL